LYPTGENKPNPIRSKTDLFRVNFEVNDLKPFPHLAFPQSKGPKTPRKLPSFDGELMASFSDLAGQAFTHQNPVNECNRDFATTILLKHRQRHSFH
jgi:hypothetical protein